MAFGGHARVDEDLRHRVLRGGRFLAQVRLVQRLDVVDRVVVADELEGVGYRLDEVFFADGGHAGWFRRALRGSGQCVRPPNAPSRSAEGFFYAEFYHWACA